MLSSEELTSVSELLEEAGEVKDKLAIQARDNALGLIKVLANNERFPVESVNKIMKCLSRKLDKVDHFGMQIDASEEGGCLVSRRVERGSFKTPSRYIMVVPIGMASLGEVNDQEQAKEIIIDFIDAASRVANRDGYKNGLVGRREKAEKAIDKGTVDPIEILKVAVKLPVMHGQEQRGPGAA